MASSLSEPFTERIYPSCCSQDSFNSELKFYLFLWTCQGLGGWEAVRLGRKRLLKRAPKDSAPISFCETAVPEAGVTRTQSTALTWSFVGLLGSPAPAGRFVTRSISIRPSSEESVCAGTDISLLWTGDVSVTSSPDREHGIRLPAHCASLYMFITVSELSCVGLGGTLSLYIYLRSLQRRN